MTKIHNFSAGPAILPQSAIDASIEALKNFSGTSLSLLEVSHRSKEFEENGIIKWGNGARIGNQTQIVNMSLNIEESNILFSSKMFRIVVYLSYAEPTIYHNFLNGIVKPKNLVLDSNTKDEDIMESYGIAPQLAEKIESII